jgi:hypothetical protein
LCRRIEFSVDRDHCVENARRLSIALLLYAQDHDETLPPAERVPPGETCLLDERRTAKGINIYTFKDNTLWNVVIGPYLKGARPFKCPNDPTGNYKEGAMSYTPLVGPASLVDPVTCEQRNGIMGKNWGIRLSAVARPGGTALLFEMINSKSKDYQLQVGTQRDHPWGVYNSSTWCGVLEDTAVYPRREMLFSYDEGNQFLGPHLGSLSLALVDGHAMNVTLAAATGGGSDDCVIPAKASAFDRRYPVGGIEQ